ncbi:MAG TPA: glyceraldehyde-3-phosphate dehydrogenase [Chitinophagales bacterium]|nr:glyceraldehyde-3-phosphate dehydrogenase [Chitinophagales bacterium]
MSNINSNPADWLEREKNALEIVNVAGKLWLDDSVELIIFRRSIVDARASEILNHHEYARNYINEPLTIENSLAICTAIADLGLAPSRIDIGMLGKEWLTEGRGNDADIAAFVERKLSNLIGKDKKVLKPKDVVLYGFGRIGRLAARLIISQTGKGEQLRLKAIVTRTNSDLDITKRSSLLRKDSVHGKFRGTVIEDLENKALIINGYPVKMIAANDPADIDYTAYGIEDALLIDNSGVWRDAEGLSQHLKSKGISKVLLTAPGKGDIPNIVYGVNHNTYAPESNDIFSAASCTTNGIAPVLAVIEKKYGIESGHIESVHSFTNDQNLLDNFHKKYRRGRSAPLNMVITETGAAKAVSKVLPQVFNKFTGNAVRVPTPDVSLAILNINVSNEVESVEEINDLLNDASAYGDLVEQIDYSTSAELVSTDCIGNNHASIVDSHATLLAPNKKSMVLYVWYDNEYGYTCQVVRLAKYLAKVQRLTYY